MAKYYDEISIEQVLPEQKKYMMPILKLHKILVVIQANFDANMVFSSNLKSALLENIEFNEFKDFNKSKITTTVYYSLDNSIQELIDINVKKDVEENYRISLKRMLMDVLNGRNLNDIDTKVAYLMDKMHLMMFSITSQEAYQYWTKKNNLDDIKSFEKQVNQVLEEIYEELYLREYNPELVRKDTLERLRNIKIRPFEF